MRSRWFILAFVAALLSRPAAAQSTPAAVVDTWTIDATHTAANFAVRHMMVSTVRGKLGNVNGTITWDGKDARTIQADVIIDVAGLDTGVEKRDNHLRSDDFFNSATYPTIAFKSKRVIPGPPGEFTLVGDLTIRSTTREVELEVEGPSAPQKVGSSLRTGATVTGTINRKEFGLLYNKMIETGGAVVADEVRMTIDIEATRPAPPVSNPD